MYQPDRNGLPKEQYDVLMLKDSVNDLSNTVRQLRQQNERLQLAVNKKRRELRKIKRSRVYRWGRRLWRLLKGQPFRSLLRDHVLRIKGQKKRHVSSAISPGETRTAEENVKAFHSPIDTQPSSQNNLGKPTVSILLLHRGELSSIRRLMGSLAGARCDISFEVILIGAEPADIHMEGWPFPVREVSTASNVTRTDVLNQGARVARGTFLLFLGDQLEALDGSIDGLVSAAARHEDCGAIGARLQCPGICNARTESASHIGLLMDGYTFELERQPGDEWLYQPSPRMDVPVQAQIQEQTDCEIGAVSSCCLMVQKDVFFQVGGYDENYADAYEDIDLCFRLIRRGHRNYAAATVFRCHADPVRDSKSRTGAGQDALYFHRRWREWLGQQIIRDRLTGRMWFTQEPLSVAVAFDEDDEYPVAEALTFMFTERGANSRIVSRRSETGSWYQLGRETDIVISLSNQYDPRYIRGLRKEALTVAWVISNDDLWLESGGISRYSYVIATDEQKSSALQKRLGGGVGVLPLTGSREGLYNSDILDPLLCMLAAQLDVHPQKAAILICASRWSDAIYWGDYYYALDMQRAFQNQGWEAEIRVMQEWYAPFDGSLVVALRGLKAYIPNADKLCIEWVISHPDMLSPEEVKTFDLVYVASRKKTDEMKQYENVQFLPQCTHQRMKREVSDAPKKTELLFVGGTGGRTRKIIEDVLPTEHDLAVYGGGWSRILARTVYRGNYMPNDQLADAYADAAIVLADSWEDMRDNGFISNRIYDALAAGAFIITDAVAGIEEEFNGCLVTYKDKEDLKQKIEYYLAHGDERREMAMRGQKKVLSEDTFDHRINAILAEAVPRLGFQ